MILILIATVILLALGIAGKRRHVYRLMSIPVRVHVNGTRGKSGVTRLIAAGLRAAGLRVMAKTTGTAARLIFADGSEIPFRRDRFRGPPSIGEQARLIRLAARNRSDALIVECMAVHPEIQQVAEEYFIRATLGVITNVRQDHSDVMGETPEDVARVLALTVPHNGTLVLGPDMIGSDIFHAVANERGTRVIRTDAANFDAEKLTPEELALFPATVFADNVATALTVCAALGFGQDADSRATLLRGMAGALTDPGELRVLQREAHGRVFRLIDAFAANDAASTLDIWHRCRTMPELQKTGNAPWIGLCCNRADRGFRLEELARDFAGPAAQQGLCGVLVLGDALFTARRRLLRAGLGFVRLPAVLTTPSVLKVLQCAAQCCPTTGDVVLFGFGNTQGMGMALRRWFEGEKA